MDNTCKCNTCGQDIDLVAAGFDKNMLESLSPEFRNSIDTLVQNLNCDECCDKIIAKREYGKWLDAMKAAKLPVRFAEWDKAIGNVNLMKFVWNNRSRSLFIADYYDTNKTRVVCAAASKLVTDQRIRYFRSVDFLSTLTTLYSNSSLEVDKFIFDCHNADLLIIDDLGKEKLTDRAGEALYSMIDYYYVNEKKLWVTSNYSGKQLAYKLNNGPDDDRGNAIVSRFQRMSLDWHEYKNNLNK